MSTFGPVSFRVSALPRYGLRTTLSLWRIVFATRKLILDIDPAVPVTVHGAANLGTLVLLAIHELDTRVMACNVANALMAFPLDLVAAPRLSIVNRLLAHHFPHILVADLPPFMATFFKLKVNFHFANFVSRILKA